MPILRLLTQMGFDGSRLEKGLAKSKNQVNAFGRDLRKRSVSLGKGLAAGVGGLFAFQGGKRLIGDLNAYAANLKNVSIATGLTIEELQQLEFAASQTNTDLQSVLTSVRQMVKSLDDMRLGTGESKEGFKSLGLTLRDFANKSRFGQLAVLGEAYARVGPGLGNAALQRILGENAGRLAPSLPQLTQFARDAKRFGLIIDKEVILKIADIGDAVDKVNRKGRAFLLNFPRNLVKGLRSLVPPPRRGYGTEEYLRTLDLADVIPRPPTPLDNTPRRVGNFDFNGFRAGSQMRTILLQIEHNTRPEL